MAMTLNSIFLVILLCGGSAAGSRTHLFTMTGEHGAAALPSAASDGQCNTAVKTQGYACEEHKVTTQDGYILSMQRIPVGRSGSTAGNRPPVLLQHGLLSDGLVWLVLPPDQALAFVLADNGFDVWIANGRGSVYSSGHISLSPNDAAYWDWSWDEMAGYDLTAMFGYVYNKTGQKLHYVGHSQGTLIALAALAKNQLLDMWRSASLLAPISYLGQIGSQFVRVASELFLKQESFWFTHGKFDPLGFDELAGKSSFMHPQSNRASELEFMLTVCTKAGVDCRNITSVVAGEDCCQNSSAVNALSDHGFQPSSSIDMIHFSQMVTRGTISMLDYDNKKENEKHYGQPTPPVYNLTSIPTDFPLFLIHGGADLLSNVKEVQSLLGSLKGHVANKLVVNYIDKYGHSDFLTAVNAKEEVYDPLIAFLKLN